MKSSGNVRIAAASVLLALCTTSASAGRADSAATKRPLTPGQSDQAVPEAMPTPTLAGTTNTAPAKDAADRERILLERIEKLERRLADSNLERSLERLQRNPRY
jgi:hypothetical protein